MDDDRLTHDVDATAGRVGDLLHARPPRPQAHPANKEALADALTTEVERRGWRARSASSSRRPERVADLSGR